MKRGLCSIAGDIIHHGHINFIRECKKKCDYLIVAVMIDEVIEEYKGFKPIMSYRERAEVIKSIIGVDRIVNNHYFDLTQIKLLIGPDIMFDSVEHKREGADVIIPYTEGISSTIIKERIIEQYLDNRKRKKKGWFKRK